MAWVTPSSRSTGDLITAAIWNADVVDNAIETAPGKAANAGDVFHATAANAIAALSVGVAGEVLAVNAGATAPEWVGGVLLIEEDVLSGGAIFDFSSIPAIFRHLRVVGFLRSDRANATDGLEMLINNDTGSNYDYMTSMTWHDAQHETDEAYGSAVGILAGLMVGDSAPADVYSHIDLIIPHYAGGDEKTVSGKVNVKFQESAGGVRVTTFNVFWRDTTAINRISFSPATGTNFVAGSMMSVYGMK